MGYERQALEICSLEIRFEPVIYNVSAEIFARNLKRIRHVYGFGYSIESSNSDRCPITIPAWINRTYVGITRSKRLHITRTFQA